MITQSPTVWLSQNIHRWVFPGACEQPKLCGRKLPKRQDNEAWRSRRSDVSIEAGWCYWDGDIPTMYSLYMERKNNVPNHHRFSIAFLVTAYSGGGVRP